MPERAHPNQSAGTWLGVYVERCDVAGLEVWSTIISAPGRDTRRRLFSDRVAARRYALDQADAHDLPLFDHVDPLAGL